MKRLAIPIMLLAAALGSAQTTADYLKLRKQFGITEPVGIEALEAFIGTRTMEIQGKVKGSFRAGGHFTLLVERTDGDNEMIDADLMPEWLLGGNDLPARLLVRATRSEDNGRLVAKLLGAAPEHVIAQIDREAQRQELRRKAAAAKSATAKRGTRPQPPKQGDWILPASEVTPLYAGFIKQRNRRLSDREAMEIAQGIIGFSIRYGVDARLIMAMVMVESGFNPNATSRAGAMGLGQLMPGTARGVGVTDAYDSMQNLYGTVRVIRGHLERYSKRADNAFEGLILALAAYNAGSGAVRRHGGVPPFRETQNYVRKVTALYAQLKGR